MAWVRNRRRERTRSGLAAIVALLGVLYTVVIVVRSGGGEAGALAVASRIDLLAATDPGDAVWGGASGPGAVPVVAPAPAVPSAAQQVSVTAIEGSTPGLYGGSRVSRCDVEGFATALEGAPDRRTAWEEAAGARDGPAPFLAGLTEVVLLRDTRVTGWRSGLAPFQGILERGTAVMVDGDGVPRVRCAGLLPLTPPRPVATTPAYAGVRWTGFDPAGVVVVVAGSPVSSFTVLDLDGAGREPLRRQPGERPH